MNNRRSCLDVCRIAGYRKAALLRARHIAPFTSDAIHERNCKAVPMSLQPNLHVCHRHCIGVARTSCGITPRHQLAEEDGDPTVVGAQLVLGLGDEWAWLRHLCCGRAGWGGALDKHIERGGEQQQKVAAAERAGEERRTSRATPQTNEHGEQGGEQQQQQVAVSASSSGSGSSLGLAVSGCGCTACAAAAWGG